MSTEPNSAPAGESTVPAATPAAPTTTTNQPTKVSPFAGMPPPNWVRNDPKLLEAHEAAEKTQPAVTKETVNVNTGETKPVASATTTAPAITAAPTAVPAPFDHETFARTLARELRPAPAGQPQQTDAELRAQLNIFEVDAAGYEEVFGVAPRDEKQLAGYNRHLQGVARQAVTMANIMNQRALQEHQNSLAPYITSVRSQEAERQKTLFFKTENPDLAGYEELAQKEFQLALSSGKKFPTADAARKYVADQVRATLKSVGITPKAVGATLPSTTTTTAPKPSTRTMTPTSVGGRSGASAASKPATKVEAVWGNKR